MSLSDLAFDDLFADETPSEDEQAPSKAWKLLLVDDDKDVHHVTKLALTGFEFEGRTLEFIEAYSAKEAKHLITKHQDIALALVDVVMEHSQAGLELIEYIRKQCNNRLIRLILRTGQPGQAPEEQVIREYDINDYKNKTELTAIKLKTLLYSSLRGYRDLCIIERHKAGLEKIISSTARFLECDTLSQFASAVLDQVANILALERSQIYCCAAISEQGKQDFGFKLLAVSGGADEQESLPEHINQAFTQACAAQTSLHDPDRFVGYFTTNRGTVNLLYVDQQTNIEEVDHDLLEFFSNNIAVAYENLKLRDNIRESQRELSYILGEAVERRSKETGSHVKRVANYSYLLATLVGVAEQRAELIRLASPLHDLGKIAIPDAILNKPGKHDQAESVVMKTHAQIGHDMLMQSQNEILQMGAVIAGQHHEKWDGSGYPVGLAGEQIDIAGRVSALADVFDALGSERCYKPAWPLSKIIELIRAERGHHFDPQLVDIMLVNIDQFLAIRDQYPDK